MQLQLVSEGIFPLSGPPLCATAYTGEDNSVFSHIANPSSNASVRAKRSAAVCRFVCLVPHRPTGHSWLIMLH